MTQFLSEHTRIGGESEHYFRGRFWGFAEFKIRIAELEAKLLEYQQEIDRLRLRNVTAKSKD